MEDKSDQKNLTIEMTPDERLDVYKAVVAVIPLAQYFSVKQFQLFIAELTANTNEYDIIEWRSSLERKNGMYLLPIPFYR